MKTIILKTSLAVILIFTLSVSAKAFTAAVSGNWSSAATWGGVGPGTTVTNADIIIPSGITVTLDMDVTFSGLSNSFTVNGSLTSSSTNAIIINQGSFSGSGSVFINKLTFTSLGTCSYTGTMNLHHFVNSCTTLLLGAVINVTDTLNMDAGTILLNTGANLTMQANSTIRVNTGTLTINGGVFNSNNNYNVLYVGTAKTTGVELNTSSLQNIYFHMNSNSEIVTLNNNLVINGNMYFTTGQLDISGKQFTLNGDLIAGAGTMFTSNSTSNMTINGNASLTSGLSFNSGSSVNDLSVNLTGNGTIKLMSGLGVSGHLKLINGNFSIENTSALTMNSGSIVHVESGSIGMNGGSFSGTASYDVEYMGGSMSSGVELTGSGLNNLTINLTSGTASISVNNNTTVAGQLNMNMGKLMLNGFMLTLNGTLASSGSASFSGTASSEIDLNLSSTTNDTIWFSVGGQTLDKLKLNLGSSGTITLGSGLTINTELNLANGKLEITNNDLSLQSTASISAYSNTNYVVTSGTGRLQLYVNSASTFVTFPVGTSDSYSPGYIQQTASGSSGNFMIRVMNGVYANGASGFNSATTASVVNRTWLIDAANGVNVNMNLKLGWDVSAEVNGFNRTVAHISHYNSSWDTYANAAASVGANSTFELTRTGITSLMSAFAVADNQAALGITDLISPDLAFNIYPNPVADVLTVEILHPGAAYLYEVFDIAGNTVLSTYNMNNIVQFSVSDFKSGYYFIKITNITNHSAITKRFIKI